MGSKYGSATLASSAQPAVAVESEEVKPKKASSSSYGSASPAQAQEAPRQKDTEQEVVKQGTELGGIAEAMTAIGTTMAAESAGGVAGVVGAVAPGEEGQGVEWLNATRDFITRLPETEAGKAKLQGFGQGLKNISELPVVREGVQAVDAWAGTARDVAGYAADQGYPRTATGIETTFVAGPEAALTLLGVKGTKKGYDVTKDTVNKAANVTGKALENMVETVAGKPVQIYDEAGMITPEVKDFLMQAQANGIDIETPTKQAIDAQNDLEGLIPSEEVFDIGTMIDNYNTFVKRGVPPTKANVTQSPEAWREQQDYLKTSGDVNEIVAHQDRRLAELARQGKAQVGPVETEIVGVNQSLYDTIVDIAETYDNAVTEAYRVARSEAPLAKNIDLTDTVKTLKQSAGDENLSGGVISSIKGELRNRGVIDENWKVVGKIDVETAEKIRQKMNQVYANDTTSGLGKDIVFGLKESLDDDVARIVGDDIFADARMAKRDFHRVLSRDKANKWEKNSESLVNKILTGRVDANKLHDVILRSRPQDFDDIKDFYLNRSGDAGINAWNNLKGQIFQQALDKATAGAQRGTSTGETISQFNGKAFENVFAPLRGRRSSTKKGDKETQFEAMFEPHERELINDIIDIARLRRPNPSNPQGSGPSGFAVDKAIKGLITGAVDNFPVLGNYVEKRSANKILKLEQEAQKQFAFPKVLTGEQEKMIKKGIK